MVPRSGTSGSYSSSVFNFLLRNLRTVFQIPIYTPISGTQGFPFCHILASTNYLSSVCCLIIAILTGVK